MEEPAICELMANQRLSQGIKRGECVRILPGAAIRDCLLIPSPVTIDMRHAPGLAGWPCCLLSRDTQGCLDSLSPTYRHWDCVSSYPSTHTSYVISGVHLHAPSSVTRKTVLHSRCTKYLLINYVSHFVMRIRRKRREESHKAPSDRNRHLFCLLV